ncbi:MAG: SufS family cysteine desulfurase [Pseudomonadota bacterium]
MNATPVIAGLSDAELEAAMRQYRADFPALDQTVNGQPLAFLDSAASSQRSQAVIDAMRHYESHDHANVHRGVHTLSHRATDAYEHARERVRQFMNAASVKEIIFTRGTTEAINLVANAWGYANLERGDEVVITHLEHHANIVPWQMLEQRLGIKLVVAPVEPNGDVLAERVIECFTARTRLLAIASVSNALGTILPLDQVIPAAKERGITVLVDGAQHAPHAAMDMQALGADFFAFSAHKMTGPTGIGVLWGRESVLNAMPPWQGGGDMIETVSFDGTTYNELPYKFEAGTPYIAGAIGLAAAIDYLESIGMHNIQRYEAILLDYLTSELSAQPDIQLIGTAPNKASVASFLMEGVHPHDLGTIVDQKGVAVRTGHHCAMPIMTLLEVPGTARASLAFYNQREDIDALIDALATVRQLFQ